MKVRVEQEIKRQVMPERNLGKKTTGADVLMQSLIAEGVDTIFGYPGGAIMPVYDALYDYSEAGRIRHVLTRHEQGAVHAAEGYAWTKGEPGVVFATSGPGATNLLTGVLNAKLDSTPLVLITGQVAQNSLGKEAFQEAPIVEASEPMTKWSYQIRNAGEIPDVLHRAFTTATTGRPGPVVIDFPKNVQLKESYYHHAETDGRGNKPTLTSETLMKLSQAVNLLNEAQRPYILAGHGVTIARAEYELLALAEKTGIPVANTLLGLSSFPTDHPLFAGMVGMHGRLAANRLTNEADVILAVGVRFADRVTGTNIARYAPQARFIHIDIEPQQLDKIVKAEIPICADAEIALGEILRGMDGRAHTDWMNKFRELDAVQNERLTKKLLAGETQYLRMAEVINRLSRLTSEDTVLVADVGQHQMKTAQFSRFKGPRSFITSGGLGTMGFALPAAIGAKIAAPEKQVIVITGDGSFQMNSQELATIAQEHLPIKIVILDNTYLGMVRQWQDRFHGGRHSFVDMQNPDFVMLALAHGIRGRSVTKREDLGGAFKKMFSARGPYLLDIKVSKGENVYPMMVPGATVEEIILE